MYYFKSFAKARLNLFRLLVFASDSISSCCINSINQKKKRKKKKIGVFPPSTGMHYSIQNLVVMIVTGVYLSLYVSVSVKFNVYLKEKLICSHLHISLSSLYYV